MEEPFSDMDARVTEIRQRLMQTIPPDSLLSIPVNYYVTIKDLPELTQPIIEYIHDFQPHMVVANDRGGRFVGLAVFGGWRHMYPETRFPSTDHKLQFSHMNGDTKRGVVQSLLDRSGVTDHFREDTSESPRIMFLDDWIYEGRSSEQFGRNIKLCLGQTADIRTGTLITAGSTWPSVVGSQTRWARTTTWENKTRVTGVRYDHLGAPRPKAGMTARAMRRRLHSALDEYYKS